MADAAVNVGVPTVKALTGWSPAAVGIWSILVTLLGSVALAAVKMSPNWMREKRESKKQQADIDAAERVENDRRENTLERRIQALEDRAQRAEQVVMQLTGATTLLLSALRAEAPENPAIAQARELVEMAVAAGGESVFAKSLARLAKVKGVGE